MPPSSTNGGTPALKFQAGSKEFHALRRKFTVSVPGKYSSLYMLNAELRGLRDLVPMTYWAHWGMCLFAEGMTGIPEIDNCRVKMILVPRGLGKSGILTQGRPIHRLLQDRDWSIGIGNEKQSNAEGFLLAIKQEFEQNELIKALFPECIPDFKTNKWAADRIEIARSRPNPVSPSVLATGVTATVTGVHMAEWILDDIISQNAAENARAGLFTEIDATNRWIQRLEPLLKNPKRDPITVIGTRWWQNDSYEWIEGDEDKPGLWGHGEKKHEFRWQLKLPDGKIQTLSLYKRGELAVFRRPAIENGASIFPERYSIEELEQMQRSNPVWFAGQYLLEPAAGGAGEFHEQHLRSYSIEGEQIRFIDRDGRLQYVPIKALTIIESLDPAFSKKSEAARTAIPVVGMWNEYIFLLEDFAERGLSVPDMVQKAVDFALRYNAPKKVYLETITAQTAIEEPLKNAFRRAGLPYVNVETIPSHRGMAKGARIRGLDNFFRSGLFYCRADQTKFKQEYLSFPQGGLVDILDALSFQIDEWIRHAQFNTSQGFGDQHGNQQAIAADLERIRRASYDYQHRRAS